MSVGEKAARGVAWNMVTGIGARAIGLIGTLILTRFIAPDDYGEVSAASICVGTGLMFANFSLGQYIIAKKATPEETYHATVAHVFLGAIAVSLTFLLGPHLGTIFDAPKIMTYIPGFMISGMLERIAYVPERTMVRDLKFRQVALTRGVGELVFTTTALSTAPMFGGMAIVFANITRGLLYVVLFARYAERGDWLDRVPLSKSVFARIFSYSWPFSVNSVAEYASGKWDNLLVSRYFGPELMGQYNLAYNLADTPTASVAEHIGDVLMPAFAQLAPKDRMPALLRAARVMAILVFPLAVGLGAVAPTVVRTFFDRRWLDVAPMLTILCVLSVVRPLSWPLGTFLQAQQRPRLLMSLGLLKILLIVLSIVTCGRYGALWTCVAVGVAFALHTLVTLICVAYLDGLSMANFLGGTVGPLLACGAMASAVVGVRWLLRLHGINAGWTSLVCEIGAGGAIYVGAAFLVARPIFDDVVNQVKRILKRSGAPK